VGRGGERRGGEEREEEGKERAMSPQYLEEVYAYDYIRYRYRRLSRQSTKSSIKTVTHCNGASLSILPLQLTLKQMLRRRQAVLGLVQRHIHRINVVQRRTTVYSACCYDTKPRAVYLRQLSCFLLVFDTPRVVNASANTKK